MRDLFLLTVPKSIAIANPRLNFVYYVLFLAMFGFCMWNFVSAKQWTTQVKVQTRPFLRIGADIGPSAATLNITNHKMCPPEQRIELANAMISEWSNLSAAEARLRALAAFPPSHWLGLNPTPLQASSTCLPICAGRANLDRCVSPLTDMDQRDSSQVAFWSARHILRSGGEYVDSFVGLSVAGATFNVSYTYKLEQAVPLFTQWFFHPGRHGKQQMTRTILVDKSGAPGKHFPPGFDAKLTPMDLLGAARDLPPQLLRGTELPWEVFRDGIELNVEVTCYNDDIELTGAGQAQAGYDGDWNLGATTEIPVCLLRVTYLRCCATYAAPHVLNGGSVVLNRAILVHASTGTSVMWFPDFSRLIMAFTSIMVLLQIPLKIVRLFTLTCLGELSRLYKRVIVQHFDIQRETATMAVTLMASSVAFLELSDSTVGKEQIPGISRARMEERMKAVLQQRRDLLNDSELHAFVGCCFENLLWGVGDELQTGITPGPGRQPTRRDGRALEDGVIDIDTFNVHCSMNNSVDLQAAVDLFDNDRKRRLFEWLFTPHGLQKAIRRVKFAKQTSGQFEEESVEDPFEEDFDKRQSDLPLCPLSVQELREQGINVFSTSGTSNWAASTRSLQSLSLEERKLHDTDHKADFQRLRVMLVGLMEKEREHEQTASVHEEVIKALRDRTSTLEAELQQTLATVQRLESENSVEGSKWTAILAGFQIKIESRMWELEIQLHERLDTAVSNNGLLEKPLPGSGMPVRERTNHSSNPGAEPRTPLEQQANLAELSDRLTLIDAELRHQTLAAKDTLKRTLERLEAELEEQRNQCQILKDKLHEERACREYCDKRVASLEAAVARAKDKGYFEDMPSVAASAASPRAASPALPGPHTFPQRRAASGPTPVRESGSGLSNQSRHDGLPEQHRKQLHKKSRYHDGVCTPSSSRMCS